MRFAPPSRVALAVLLGSIAGALTAESIQGTATFRERIAVPATAIFEVALEDVSRADTPAETIARTRMWSPGNPPIAFTISYDPAKIRAGRRYAVRARVLVDERLLFTTDTAVPVLTGLSPRSVSLMLRRASAETITPVTPGGSGSLEGTYWRAIELGGRPTPAQDSSREAHLTFQPDGRVSGSNGCNRIVGSHTRRGDAVTFGQMAETRMACIGAAAEVERRFRSAMKATTRLTIAAGRLELYDSSGNRVAVFAARPQPTSRGLEGTSWRLVEFRGGDGTTLRPDDGAKYTIAFEADGRLTARIDCNRGRGTWKSAGPNALTFGPLALTRARCPAGSLHDQIVKQWPYVRSYVIRNGRLFLSLMADGGIYEFEPVGRQRL
jgi:putative lipoprotein